MGGLGPAVGSRGQEMGDPGQAMGSRSQGMGRWVRGADDPGSPIRRPYQAMGTLHSGAARRAPVGSTTRAARRTRASSTAVGGRPARSLRTGPRSRAVGRPRVSTGDPRRRRAEDPQPPVAPDAPPEAEARSARDAPPEAMPARRGGHPPEAARRSGAPAQRVGLRAEARRRDSQARSPLRPAERCRDRARCSGPRRRGAHTRGAVRAHRPRARRRRSARGG